MSIEITMPRLSDTMESGTVIKWSVSEGDEVSSGDAIADVETDKATMEMQVYDDGRIAKILVPEGQQVEVGTVIAVLAEEGEDLDEVAREAKSAATAGSTGKETPPNRDEEEERARPPEESAPAAASVEQGVEAASPAPAPEAGPSVSAAELSGSRAAPSTNGAGAGGGDGRMRVSPVARRLADDHDLDLGAIQGSGPAGRIIKRDVLKALEEGAPAATSAAPAPTPAPAGEVRLQAGEQPLSNMRQTIARRLVEAKQTAPHYQVTFTFNMDPLLELRKTLNEQLASQGVKLSVNDFLVRACALAIHQHPEFNASWGGDKLVFKGDVNVGVAISLPRERGGGLVVATIRHADRKGLRQISEETRQLAEKARTRGLTIEEMQDSTFTISNLGMYGVTHFTAIINPPNSAILAVGAAEEKPVVRDGQIVVGHEMQATLSLDHRIIDGAMAAEYLQTLQQSIENPATLLV